MIQKLFLGQVIVDLTGRDFPAAEGITIDDQNLELAGRGSDSRQNDVQRDLDWFQAGLDVDEFQSERK